VLRKKINTNTT